MANAAGELGELCSFWVCHEGSWNEYGTLNIIIHQFTFSYNITSIFITVLEIAGSLGVPDDEFDVNSLRRKISVL
jgi:hypothetical protein